MPDYDPVWLLGIAKLRVAQIQRLIRMRKIEHADEDEVLDAIWHECHCIIADEEPE